MLDTMKKLIIELYKLYYRGAYDSVEKSILYAEETFSLYYKVNLNELHKAIQNYIDSIDKLWEDAYISQDRDKLNNHEFILGLGINDILNKYAIQDSND